MEHEFERQLRVLAIERRPEACLGCGFEHGCSVHGCAVIHAAVNRLAAYEETRLEPEDMKRAFNEDAILKLAGQVLGVSSDRLRELAQAEKKGRLVVLPCDVGDKLYDVTLGEVREKIVISLSMLLSKSVNHLVIHAENFRNAVTSYELQDIGKTVFLTREAAEAALDAMGGENNA